MTLSNILNTVARPLRTRKGRLMIAGLLYAWFGERLGLTEEQIYIGVGLITAVILGIAVEDHGRNSGPLRREASLPAGEPAPPKGESETKQT